MITPKVSSTAAWSFRERFQVTGDNFFLSNYRRRHLGMSGNSNAIREIRLLALQCKSQAVAEIVISGNARSV